MDTHRHRARRRRERHIETEAPRPEPADDKVLRGLVGAGPSQLSLGAAMRARDASRPTDEDLAEAEESVVLVRRRYVPTENLPPGIKPAGHRPGLNLEPAH
ncbi:hypothetical protein [Cryptosporangium sp. NPDC048952]|uniref:hypothetical protein n=1 Tax=Cryptosporangium sp. NPDC048952 TaxID=3363961 RepID=UPI003716CF44